MPACCSASSMTGSNRCRCARAATSGTTPPKRACRSVCEAITLARTAGSSVKTAAAVSSQEVSMARKYMGLDPAATGAGPRRPSLLLQFALEVLHQVLHDETLFRADMHHRPALPQAVGDNGADCRHAYAP